MYQQDLGGSPGDGALGHVHALKNNLEKTDVDFK